MASTLKVLFEGLGSIGRRHLRNLREVTEEMGLSVVVDALRHDKSIPIAQEIASLVGAQYESVSELNAPYDLIFVCNPSQLHVQALLQLKDMGKTFFVEKPVSVSPISDSTMEVLGDPDRYCVACPLRHTAVYRAIRDFVSANKVLAVRAVCSSYLPDWRPGVDYSKLYSARRESGGVKMDLIHEFDYLFSLFGFPETAVLFEKKVSNLAIECADVATFAGMYTNMSMEVHLDYFGRKTERSLLVWTPDDVVVFDFISGRKRSLTSGMECFVGDRDRNDAYLAEMRTFLRFASGTGMNINNLKFANKIISEICTISVAS